MNIQWILQYGSMCGLNLFFAENAPTCYVNLVAFIKGSKIKLQKKKELKC